MNWINRLGRNVKKFTRPTKGDNQRQLILLVCIPCLFVSSVSLYIANISVYLIAFIMIILLLIASYVIVASKRRSEYQIRTLSNLIESMIDGDYSLRGKLQTNQAFQELLNLINDLADALSKHKIEAKESRLLLERIMEQMDAMVLATNDEGYIVMANASANKLILGNTDDYLTTKLSELSIGTEIIHSRSGIIDFNNEQLTGEHFLFTESFLSEGKKHHLYMLTNAERLLMEKERRAWQSLLRVLSHEMNNSLAPIAAISQSMQSQLQSSGKQLDTSSLLEGVDIINERAESLNRFIASYSQLSHLPQPNLQAINLGTMLSAVALLYPDCECTIADCDDMVSVDKEQFEQVLINLFKNSNEAMNNQNDKRNEVSCESDTNWLKVLVKDYGVGIANLENIFVPFYTTKSQGSGIGLALCRQIMFNHSGTIDIVNNTGMDGVTVTLALPTQ